MRNVRGFFIQAWLVGVLSTTSWSQTATFLGYDNATQGNWKGKYGSEGYSLAADGASNPYYVTPASSGSTYIWSNSTSDVRALQKANGTDRIAATWYGQSNGFSIDLNFKDQNFHQVAIYCVDWDSYGPRRQTIEVLDANNNVLDIRFLGNFVGGQYLIYNLKGHVKIRANALTTNAVIEGIFFGGGATSTSGASFVGWDTTTQGNWKSKYGSEGYSLAAEATVNPAYVVPANSASTYIWTNSTSDIRALQKSTGTDRIASTWYGQSSSFFIDLNFTDQNSHQVAIYCLDWDTYGPRRQTIEILDANNNVLDTRYLGSFVGGQYLIWNLKGRVRIRANSLSTNAVIGGIFFGNGAPAGESVVPIPQLQTWEQNMTVNGSRFCVESEINSAINSGGVATEANVWYYDGTKVYSQMAAYTKNPFWLTCAGYTNNAYRNWVLARTEGVSWPVGALNGWRIFPEGLMADYKATGNALSKTAVQRLAQLSAFAESGGNPGCLYARETAYMIDAYVAWESLSGQRSPVLATSVNYALGHIDQWFVSKTCPTLYPFMVGLTLESLISYYKLTGDSRIPPAIALAADELWNRAWVPAKSAFYYDNTNPADAPADLNLLTAPAYAWLWQLTGDRKYLDRGDQIFAGGVLYGNFWSGKQFSQLYRYSFDYVLWRSAPSRTIPLTVAR